MNSLTTLRSELQTLADPYKAKNHQRFFKTGKGEYGHGDIFLGITVPMLRKVAAAYKQLPLQDIQILLQSVFHEERLIALFMLVRNFQVGSQAVKKDIFDVYLAHTQFINNWDLVDSSADKIVGNYLLEKDKSILLTFAASESLWERRIAMIATFQFLKKQQDPTWTFKIATILIPDKHDLIQKATGWMLREVGNKCGQEVLEVFLKEHYRSMGRTALRYALEKFPMDLRARYMKKS